VIIVPIVEELFWRGWAPRWIDRMDDFQALPLGSFTTRSFLLTAALFGVEHGSYWDVGFAAGVGYNWWVWKTRSLGDLILSHAVTNACLAGWVLGTGQWQYW
jgi:CAAX prenyl protease-like protein